MALGIGKNASVVKGGIDAAVGRMKGHGLKKLAGNAGVGAIAGGFTGAGVNMVRGEDAWEGAKKGAVVGAVGYGGIKATRVGTGAAVKEGTLESVRRYGKETGMTKSVKAIAQNQKNNAVNQATNFRKNFKKKG